MNALEEYLKGYVGGVKSLLVGMRTSMKVFCQKKITEQYPETATRLSIFRNATEPCSKCRSMRTETTVALLADCAR